MLIPIKSITSEYSDIDTIRVGHWVRILKKYQPSPIAVFHCGDGCYSVNQNHVVALEAYKLIFQDDLSHQVECHVLN